MKIITYLIFNLILTLLLPCFCFAQFNETEGGDIVIYRVNPELLDSFETVKKGTVVNLLLHDEISTKNDKPLKKIKLTALDNKKNPINAEGLVTYTTKAGIFSRNSSVQLSLRNINSEETGELFFPANSSLFSEVHPPHANTNSLRLTRTITNLSIASSPVTFGTSLGISFLAGGILSAHQNGIKDFIWGGLDGSGLSFIESLFRKQPETFLEKGITIPFTLNQDIKISRGITTDKPIHAEVAKDLATSKIETLLQWGDLAGALELAVQTNQKERYEELLKKISLR